jgi:hypothetical protein
VRITVWHMASFCLVDRNPTLMVEKVLSSQIITHHIPITPRELSLTLRRVTSKKGGNFQMYSNKNNYLFYNNAIDTLIVLITYLLTPWSRVRLEKLTSLQLVKKFPEFYGTRRFFTVLTSARNPSLSSANSIQSPRPPPTS